MSVFVNVVRYVKGNFEPITEADLKTAVKSLPGFGIVRDKEIGAVGVRMPKMQMIAELEETGVLSCQYDRAPDGNRLIENLKTLAAKIPGAFVEDEDGGIVK